MEKLQELLKLRDQLSMLLRVIDRNASFETEEGRVCAQTLAKLAVVQMQIETLQKEKSPTYRSD